jgi:ribosomal protein S18 acetylase RimI-like enzyme
MVDIRLAEPDDWTLLRDVRLRALADAPGAFASTLSREQAFDEAEWRGRITRGPWWLALDGGRAVGLVAAFAEDDDERHLVAMWVDPAHRGSAVAAQLVEAARAWAASDGGRTLILWVADGNERARRFYERLGFRGTGVRQPLPSAPQVGEELLRRVL